MTKLPGADPCHGVDMAPHQTARQISALGQGSPVRVSDALAAGLSRSAIRAAIAHGHLVQPRRGCLLSADDVILDQRATHLRLCQAILSRLEGRMVISHASAAVLQGLPLPPGVTTDQVHVTALNQHRHRYPGVVIHAARGFDEADLIEIEGMLVTSPIRTAVDVARGMSLPRALIPLDAAVRKVIIEHPDQSPYSRDTDRVLVASIVDPVMASLESYSHRLKRCKGVPMLRRALEYVSPLAESPLESASRGRMIDGGITPLALQFEFVDGLGADRRADFLLADGLIGEADGLMKYEGPDGKARLHEEKLRDVASAEVGFRTARWTSADVWMRYEEWLRRVRRDIASHARWTGRHAS